MHKNCTGLRNFSFGDVLRWRGCPNEGGNDIVKPTDNTCVKQHLIVKHQERRFKTKSVLEADFYAEFKSVFKFVLGAAIPEI